MTIREHKSALAGLTVAFLGDGGSNMAHSYLLAGATAGMNVRVACPPEFSPAQSVVADARAIATSTGGSVLVTEEPSEALTGADVVVTDTWVSMGKEAEKAERVSTFGRYQVDLQAMELADSEAIFLHCLPADRGFEVAPEVIDGPSSVIWDESENRLHAQKALLVWLLQRA
jgi:ornithine carbamoyltransferase